MTAIIGASPDPMRYAFRARDMLKQRGHSVVLINPRYTSIEQDPCYPTLEKAAQGMGQPLDTLTIYVSPAHLGPMMDDIIAAKPRRVIFNPGSESAAAATRLRQAGIAVVEACTLVMLSTGQY